MSDNKYEVKENTFTLFPNDRKENERHPDYRGSGKDADGNEFWISCWLKTPQKGGDKFYSCLYNLKDDREVKGSLSFFVNNRKEKDGQPDFTGSGKDPNGKEFFVSCWKKEGKVFVSASITYKDGNKEVQKQEEPDASSLFNSEDDTPF